MEPGSFLLYGANGYTGKLIAHIAKEYGLKPILAGRREEALEPLAKELNTTYQVVDLNDAAKLESVLQNVPLVLHAAGPFKNTAKQMIEACLKTKTHYIDITGEIAVFEMAKKYHDAALKAGILLMPGSGFDVVPTDCIALFLKNKLPDATELKLAFASIGGGLSHGTALTMAGAMGEKSAVRKEGKIVRVPLGHKGMWVDFSAGSGGGVKKLFVMTIPWGDISTAYSSTGIPNIETYTGAATKTFKLLKFQFLYNWLLRTSYMRNRQMKKINSKPAGPSDEKRAKSKSLVWGEVKNANGEMAQARLVGPDGYTLTAHSSLIIAKKILEGNFKPGYQTPAACYGADLILEVPGVSRNSL
jgi:short subunit dehydrogenase-like uncharacterized protein